MFDAIPNLRIPEVDEDLDSFKGDSDDEPFDKELLNG